MSRLGLDRVAAEGFARWRGKRIGWVCNQASVAYDFVHGLDHILPCHLRGELVLEAVFGPQHGIWGHTQDNMIEWQGYADSRTGLSFYSLYGEHREPTDEMLDGVEELVIDLPDVGSRYYTFIWSMALCLKACEQRGIPVTILDRPNPIDGVTREGPVLEPEYASFVGLYPLPIRHGMTIGEVARHLAATEFPAVELEVVECEGWDRSLYLDDTAFPWVMPSPNMPTVDTAVVYPGLCLLEGTNLSEGRGTTRPFETFGAPFMDAWELAAVLNGAGLPGVLFRPVEFQPTFQKHVGEVCGGCFIHILDRRQFKPFLTGCQILQSVMEMYPDEFAWKQPPYEYEERLLPIDILLGNGWLRKEIEGGVRLPDLLS